MNAGAFPDRLSISFGEAASGALEMIQHAIDHGRGDVWGNTDPAVVQYCRCHVGA